MKAIRIIKESTKPVSEAIYKLIYKTPDENKNFDDSIIKLYKLEQDLKNTENEINKIKTTLKEKALKIYIQEYKKNQKNPKSFWLESAFNNKILFVPMDAYKKINKEKFLYLKKVYGTKFINDNIDYSIDPIIYKKYKKEINEFISKKVKPEDRETFININHNYTVAKGSIENLLKVENPDRLLEDICPNIQLKSITLNVTKDNKNA